MKADAIIFDKDGTLLDFDAFWVKVSEAAINAVLEELGRTDIPLAEIMTALGVRDGVTSLDSVICYGTYGQLGNELHELFKNYGCTVPCEWLTEKVTAGYEANISRGEIRPTCSELAEVLKELKKRGKKLAVVTADNEVVTRSCLKGLGIEEFFDWIYTDNGTFPPKPDPYCADDFSKRSGIGKERMVMVGDTMSDALFAKNAGISLIAVGKIEENRQKLAPYAEAVFPDVSYLRDAIE